MAVTLYSYSDSGAPQIQGMTGYLEALLNAVLVTGYGSKSGAGWTSPYYDSGTKTRCFRTGGSGDKGWLQIIDNGPGSGSYKEARARGYESMSAYNAGDGAFPTAAQSSFGVCVRKSFSLSSNPNTRWWAVASDSLFHLFIDTVDVAGAVALFSYGRFKSKKSGDKYNFYITARDIENSSSYQISVERSILVYPTIGSVGGAYAMRSFTGIGGSVSIGKHINSALSMVTAAAHCGSSGMETPLWVDGGLYTCKINIHELNRIRGSIPGLRAPLHALPLPGLSTYVGLNDLLGKTFMVFNAGTGQVFAEISDTWDV